MSHSKRVGTAAESLVVDFLQRHGFRYAERRALRGVNDCGDVTGIPGVVGE
jgi:Holliday junction resolvase-like predicted endonuclease